VNSENKKPSFLDKKREQFRDCFEGAYPVDGIARAVNSQIVLDAIRTKEIYSWPRARLLKTTIRALWRDTNITGSSMKKTKGKGKGRKC